MQCVCMRACVRDTCVLVAAGRGEGEGGRGQLYLSAAGAFMEGNTHAFQLLAAFQQVLVLTALAEGVHMRVLHWQPYPCISTLACVRVHELPRTGCF